MGEIKLSNCCNREVGINEGASVTHFYICKGCGNACDVHDEPETKPEWEDEFDKEFYTSGTGYICRNNCDRSVVSLFELKEYFRQLLTGESRRAVMEYKTILKEFTESFKSDKYLCSGKDKSLDNVYLKAMELITRD